MRIVFLAVICWALFSTSTNAFNDSLNTIFFSPSGTRDWAFVPQPIWGTNGTAWSGENGGWLGKPIDGLHAVTGNDPTACFYFGVEAWPSPTPKFFMMTDQFMTPSGGSAIDMGQAAQGAYNSAWLTCLQTIASQMTSDWPNSPIRIVRIWQEINGTWFDWSVNYTGATSIDGTANGDDWPSATIIAAFDNMATQVRTVWPNALIEWNLNCGGSFGPPDFSAYPGDAYVDVIGMDCYEKNQTFAATQSTGDVNLGTILSFAEEHNKLVSWSETAAHDCDGTYLTSIAQWFDSLGSRGAYFSYYDVGTADGGDNVIWTTNSEVTTDACAANTLQAALAASSAGRKTWGQNWPSTKVAATTYTLSGPTGGTIGSPTSNFTVQATGYLASSVTITPSDNNNNGTFTPSSVTLNAGEFTSATFTYTAADTGTYNISTTNSASLTNPSAISFTVAANGCPASSQPTNLLSNADDFTGSGWNSSGLTFTSGALADPCGSGTDGWSVVDTGSSYHQTSQSIFSATGGDPYTVAVFVKQNAGRYCILGIMGGSDSFYGVIDTEEGTLTTYTSGSGTVTGHTITASNGWYYVTLTGTESTSTTYYPIFALSDTATPGTLQPEYTASGVGVYIYNMRMSAGSE